MTKARLSRVLVFPVAFAAHVSRSVLRRIQLAMLHQRGAVITALADDTPPPESAPTVLVVLTHVVSDAESKDLKLAQPKLERLSACLQGLLRSFAHCRMEIVVNTYQSQHLCGLLPEHVQRRLVVRSHTDCDPMMIEFRAQDEYIARQDEFDWFLFLEDDIIIHDSLLLEKIKRFNRRSASDRSVLLPNRFEMFEGRKTYIDLIDHNKAKPFAFDRTSIFEIDGVRFAQCANPHAAFYCLDRKQLRRWVESGRQWYNRVSFVGPLESAATGCLLECFDLFKPHAANLHYLEVEHLDTKYSKAAIETRARVGSVEGFSSL